MSEILVLNGKTYITPDMLIGDDFYGYSDPIVAGTGQVLPVAIAMLVDGVAEAARLRTATSASSKNGGLTGSQAWVLTSNTSFPNGSFVTIARTSDPDAVSYYARVTGYDPGTSTLTVTVIDASGAGGPYTDWTVNVSGPKGPAGAAAPFADSAALVKGSVDATKQLQVDVSGLSPSVTRVLTMPDANVDLGALAPKASPTFTGTPAAPTAAANTNTTQLATTAFVLGQAASQAEQEAASSTTKLVTPGRQQFHPSACKAWLNMNGQGTIALRGSYNITSLTDNGTGDFTVTIGTDFSDTSYCVTGMGSIYAGGGGSSGLIVSELLAGASSFNRTAGTFRIYCQTNAFALNDGFSINLAFFGDQ